MPADIDRAKYISFTSYKRDGDAVSLPVWVVPFEGGYAFTTDGPSFKVKRVRNNRAVTMEVCSLRGKVAPGATVHHGSAEVLEGEPVAAVRKAVKRKSGSIYGLAPTPQNLWAKPPQKPDNGTVAIKVPLPAAS